MSSRIEVDAAAPPLPIAGHILEELERHAVEAYPEECCGLIIGDEVTRYRRAYRCGNEMTARHQRDPVAYPRDGRAAYYMNEQDYMRALKEARADGRDVTAVYHSHVGAGAYLSEMDLEYAQSELFPFPQADQIVLAVYERIVQASAVFCRIEAGFQGRTVMRADS